MANMTFALDASTKKQFTDFCNEVGLSASSVINVCIKTIVRERRIPFIIEAPLVPNAETIAAMEEGDRIVNDPTRKHFTNLEEFWKDLES